MRHRAPPQPGQQPASRQAARGGPLILLPQGRPLLGQPARQAGPAQPLAQTRPPATAVAGARRCSRPSWLPRRSRPARQLPRAPSLQQRQPRRRRRSPPPARAATRATPSHPLGPSWAQPSSLPRAAQARAAQRRSQRMRPPASPRRPPSRRPQRPRALRRRLPQQPLTRAAQRTTARQMRRQSPQPGRRLWCLPRRRSPLERRSHRRRREAAAVPVHTVAARRQPATCSARRACGNPEPQRPQRLVERACWRLRHGRRCRSLAVRSRRRLQPQPLLPRSALRVLMQPAEPACHSPAGSVAGKLTALQAWGRQRRAA